MTLPRELGPMPTDRRMRTVDELLVGAPIATIFPLAADVLQWPVHLPHYRYVRFLERSSGGGVVEMSANRPFVGGTLNWPTFWTSLMRVTSPGSAGDAPPSIRFRHVRGVTEGMDVEWTFDDVHGRTLVRVVHLWNGPQWPLIGEVAARGVIGPVFVHGIASRTLAGLARAAERMLTDRSPIEVSRG